MKSKIFIVVHADFKNTQEAEKATVLLNGLLRIFTKVHDKSKIIYEITGEDTND